MIEKNSDRFESLYNDSLIIDGCAPIWVPPGQDVYSYYLKRYWEGGVTAAFATVSGGMTYILDTLKDISILNHIVAKHDNLMQVLTVDDIYKAKKENKLGIIYTFQSTTHLQGDLRMVENYYKMGIRQMLLAYNTASLAGDGCTEKRNAGITEFGENLIKEMNKVGMIVDLAHTGYRTTMEAMEVSDAPMIFSHGNVHSVYESPRNLMDDQIIKVAQKGGFVGLNVVPYFISGDPKPTIDQYVDHIEYIAKLVGIDHVGIGTDYFPASADFGTTDKDATALYNYLISIDYWQKDVYPAPPWYSPTEIATPDKFGYIVPALKKRGFVDSDIKKILGDNYMRVIKEVWK